MGRTKHSFVKRYGLQHAVKIAFGIHVKGKIEPSVALEIPREKVKKLTEKTLRGMANSQGREANKEARKEFVESLEEDHKKIQEIVGRMRNWERTKWAKTGYPGRKDLKALVKFCEGNLWIYALKGVRDG